ncbi:GspE/PulE family protein [Aliamphritea spongicola]|uniref:GspE/PulE family protein n=1 Tax=Aliamphritea spongicola TaxID=707589 RepID=UPI00196B4D93|nr:GspE/PulE family protein [Aliamphritea spongicola]MBN3561221.1 type II/IV secretion system protein [Aliamphritea spongicola]
MGNHVGSVLSDIHDLHLQLADLLIGRQKISPDEMAKCKLLLAEQPDTSLPHLLYKLGFVGAADLAAYLAELSNLSVITDEALSQAFSCSELLAPDFLKQHQLAPVSFDDNVLTLAVFDPGNSFAIHCAEMATGAREVRLYVISKTDLDIFLKALSGDANSHLSDLSQQASVGVIDYEKDVDQLRDMASEAPVIQLVNLLIQQACKRNASDIHVEPFNGVLKIRFRCDGELVLVESPPANLTAAVISRLKIMAGMNIAERRLPQDGRINIKVQGHHLDIRISTLPTVHGESMVLRLLRTDQLTLDFNDLGIRDGALDQLLSALRQPTGMVLVTGPTGSGKSTTLYAALKLLNSEQRKIISVEDPVEYQIDGINQIPVNTDIGLGFVTVLRSIVRQDPDIIMVGEMRDHETARISVQSALTGHLVLSTVHTNDAASSITRLIDMGIEGYLLASTLLCVVAQRLVKRLCPHCAEPYTPDENVLAALAPEYISESEPDICFYRPAGCAECDNRGVSGRIAIVEVLTVSDALRKSMLKLADADAFRKLALQENMQPMISDGLSKARAGLVCIEDVIRVTREV